MDTILCEECRTNECEWFDDYDGIRRCNLCHIKVYKWKDTAYCIPTSDKIQRQYNKYSAVVGGDWVERNGIVLFKTEKERDLFEHAFKRRYYGVKMENLYIRMGLPCDNKKAAYIFAQIRLLQNSYSCRCHFFDCSHRSSEEFDYMYNLLKNAP